MHLFMYCSMVAEALITHFNREAVCGSINYFLLLFFSRRHRQLPAQKKVRFIAAESHKVVGEIREAIREITPQRDNMHEICFRTGNLYQVLRHELEENGTQARLTPKQKVLVNQLIADAKSLPSFCGDKEKAARDPGYEAIPEGDINELQRELTIIDARSQQLQKER